ncbi:dipeptide epimerase [Ktedonosporobacter rubrisoli]|uniref:Dipeptide epimerase n=1 Tax=Ktedonosporobacter rubrisoli TaxID=2509675 RepID=A0A4P6K050_KTERU|nr:dipeptide epimerase [Ktedonosporobacter rubrisoli]QBD81305.1 dipeptide epimerase [Ktedonosporobacter rubrisoli]
MSGTTIKSINVEPLNIPLLEPFTIATGSVNSARNVLITVTLQDGSRGYGECAPFPPSTGESQETALAAAQGCAELLKGRDAAHWRVLAKLMRSVFYSQTTACAGMEMALLDALTRSYGIPLYTFFGGASSFVETDMSIPIVTPERGYELAKETVERGITSIKIKVGSDLREDVERVEAIRSGAPNLPLTLDANQGYTANEALLCLEALDDHDIRPILMEQPVHKDDYEGLRYVTQHTTVPVAADESAANSAAVARLIGMGAANVVNVKLMKSGIVDALDIAALCRAHHIQLMVGAMIESRLASSMAAHLVAGLGGFSFVDLDTPMLLAEDPFTGGYEQRGGIYDLSSVKSGLGIELK